MTGKDDKKVKRLQDAVWALMHYATHGDVAKMPSEVQRVIDEVRELKLSDPEILKARRAR